MNKVIKLALKLVKTSFVVIDDKKKASGKKQALFFVVLIVLMLPNIFAFSYITREITEFLVPLSQETVVLSLLLQLGFTIIIFSSVFMIPSYMFYAKDIEKLLPLPLSHVQLFLAKLLQVHIYQIGFLMLIILPPLTGYILAAGFSWSLIAFVFASWLNAMVTMIMISVILVIIMSVSPWFKDKDRVTLVMSIIALGVALFINYNIGGLDLANPETIALSLIQGNQSLSEGFFSYFPHLNMSVSLMINFSWVNFVIYVVGAFLFMGLVIKLFASTLVNIMATFQGGPASKKMSIKSLRGHKIRPALYAFTLKELKLLFRTPIYFFNNVLVVLLLPIIMAVSFTQASGEFSISMLSSFIASEPLILVLGALGLSAIFSTINLVTPTSISREGENKYHMLLYPVKMTTQLYAKFLSGIIISSIGVLPILLLIIIGNSLYFKLELIWVVYSILSALIIMIFINIFGLVVDVYHPKLVWENEQAAVKQNINFLFTFLAATAIIGFLAYSFFNLQSYTSWIFISTHGALIIAIIGLHRIIRTKSHDLLIEH
jgi:ABC-2 type transport system permease protein